MEDLFGEKPVQRKIVRNTITVTSSSVLLNSDKIKSLEDYIKNEVSAGKVVQNFIYEQLKKYKGEVEEVQYVVETSKVVKQKAVVRSSVKQDFIQEYNSWPTVEQWKVKWKEELPEWLYKDAINSFQENVKYNRAKDISLSLAIGMDRKKCRVDFDVWHKVIMFLKNGGDLKIEEFSKPETALIILFNLKD